VAARGAQHATTAAVGDPAECRGGDRDRPAVPTAGRRGVPRWLWTRTGDADPACAGDRDRNRHTDGDNKHTNVDRHASRAVWAVRLCHHHASADVHDRAGRANGNASTGPAPTTMPVTS